MNAVTVDRDGATGLLTFNRPEVLNAFNSEIQVESVAALDDFAADPSIRSVIVTGAGRAFSSGFDLNPMNADSSDGVVTTWKFDHDESERFQLAFWEFPKPIIAATNGYALGGACEIAMLCDLTVASSDCKFGEPEIRLGYGSTMSVLMAYLLPVKIARELLYSGTLIDARRAYEVGLVNAVVEPEQLLDEAKRRAAVLNLINPRAVRLMKESVTSALELGGARSAFAQNRNLAAILAGAAHADNLEFDEYAAAHGVAAALKQRQSQFKALGA